MSIWEPASMAELLRLDEVTAGYRDTVVLERDRKSTRLNSSHLVISYAVFCLKKQRAHHLTAVHNLQRRTRDAGLLGDAGGIPRFPPRPLFGQRLHVVAAPCVEGSPCLSRNRL